MNRKMNKNLFITVCIALLLTGCKEKDTKEVLAPPSVESKTETQETKLTAEQTTEQTVGQETEEISLYLNGNNIQTDEKAYYVDGNVMVPFSQICDNFSRSITCTTEEDVLTVTDSKNDNVIIISAGSDKASVNGKEITMQCEAVLSSNGVVMVELSSFRTLLDADNKYQDEIKSAYITESGLC